MIKPLSLDAEQVLMRQMYLRGDWSPVIVELLEWAREKWLQEKALVKWLEED